MQYISTRNSSLRKSFSEVLLGGLAPDGGLYMPQQTLRFSMAQIENLNSLTYQEITTEILHQFVSDEISKKDFENIVNNRKDSPFISIMDFCQRVDLRAISWPYISF